MNKLTVPSIVIVTLLVGDNAFALPTLHPNSQAYRIQTPAAATGRAGNASLQARALLNKDGTTDVNVTTGQLDASATAPGNISKLQVKSFDGAGDVEWAKNYNGLTSGGSLFYNYPELHRGEPWQAQANIDGIDKRTDVVTVSGIVKLRPDLTVKRIDAPSQATVGSHVNISALVSEINGDVGARGDCVLSIDGAQVDQALGIYVDSGSSVSCAFNYQFNTTGQHAIVVSVGNVVPGDYDTSNNSASANIQIVEASQPFYYSAVAYRYSTNDSGSWDNSYQSSDGTYGSTWDWGYSWTNIGQYEGTSISGFSPNGLVFPLSNATLSMSADGASIDTSTYSDVAQWNWGNSTCGNGSVWLWNPTTFTGFYIDSYSCNGYGSTMVQYGRWAGDVVYMSQNNWNYWSDTNGASGSYSYGWIDNGSQYGQFWPMTSQAQINLMVSDANGQTIQASPTVSLTSFTNVYSYPRTCSTQSWTYQTSSWSEQTCSSANIDESGVLGYAYGSTP